MNPATATRRIVQEARGLHWKARICRWRKSIWHGWIFSVPLVYTGWSETGWRDCRISERIEVALSGSLVVSRRLDEGIFESTVEATPRNPVNGSATTGARNWSKSKLNLPRIFSPVLKRAMFPQVLVTLLLPKWKRLILRD